jgi:hypothetical protein
MGIMFLGLGIVVIASIVAFSGRQPKSGVINPRTGLDEPSPPRGRRRVAAIVLFALGFLVMFLGITSSPGDGSCNADGRCNSSYGNWQIGEP